ncbi:zinc finger BED domain-containing protein DAYSLEEPER-like protein [Tanacetum coccineum]
MLGHLLPGTSTSAARPFTQPSTANIARPFTEHYSMPATYNQPTNQNAQRARTTHVDNTITTNLLPKHLNHLPPLLLGHLPPRLPVLLLIMDTGDVHPMNIDEESDDSVEELGNPTQSEGVATKLAMDILCVPISTVASESAFSLGGRILDQYRSSMKPSNVEALICTRDWLFTEKAMSHADLEKVTENIMALDINEDEE